MTYNAFTRADKSHIGKWWWHIDRWILGSAIILILISIFLNMAASPPVAERINVEHFFFVKRHIIMAIPGIFVIFGLSFISKQNLRLLCWPLFFTSIMLLILVPLIGVEIKGAKRWVSILGFSLQPSEFIKPTFVILTGWLLSQRKFQNPNPMVISAGSLAICLGLIMLQPDFGMSFIISTTWFIQLFVAGLSLVWIISIILGGLFSLILAYTLFPHVASRIDRFLDPESGDRYQVNQSIEAFSNGGFFGTGPGEGIIKHHLPDAHADFIFPVLGEEFGLISCLVVLFLYLIIGGRSLIKAHQSTNTFIQLSLVGLAFQFLSQATVNIGSALNLIPTKGMTLPFLSYGGSSFLSVSFTIGAILCLTRKASYEDEH